MFQHSALPCQLRLWTAAAGAAPGDAIHDELALQAGAWAGTSLDFPVAGVQGVKKLHLLVGF